MGRIRRLRDTDLSGVAIFDAVDHISGSEHWVEIKERFCGGSDPPLLLSYMESLRVLMWVPFFLLFAPTWLSSWEALFPLMQTVDLFLTEAKQTCSISSDMFGKCDIFRHLNIFHFVYTDSSFGLFIFCNYTF